MTETELLALIDSEERNALGWQDGELNFQREKALKYFNQEPYGNEVEGRSQVVSSEVSDTVLWILPSLLKIFSASDKAVEFEPEEPNDEVPTKQATDTCNFVFYRQNNGFLVLHNFFFDGLLSKNGYAKVFYEKKNRKTREFYQGLTENQLALLNQSKVKIVQATSYPDPNALPMGAMPMQGPPGMEQQGMPNPAAMLYDVVLEIENEKGKVCIAPVPPEEMLIHKDLAEVDLQEAYFVAQRTKKTVSELTEMGYDVEDLPTDEGQVDTSPEYQARRIYAEEETNYEKLDPTRRYLWVTEAYVRVDWDGDGVSELRRVLKAGRKILENEEAEVIPFASLTPVIMSHRHIGKSVADLMMDLQLIKSTLFRQILDGVYLTTAPRMLVPSTSQGAPLANLDDLLTVRPGGLVRYWGPQAPTPMVTDFPLQHALKTVEYVDAVGENRVGVTKYNQGLDANSLNKTATGITQIMTAAQQRIELIARIFAETGVKKIFQLILHCLTKYHMKNITFRLRNEWQDFDPRAWKNQYDMTINVGLGTGNKDQQLQHLAQIALNQAEAVKMGGMGLLLTPKNIYNVQTKIVENAGFKNVEDFWTDPEDRMPEPQPDPKAEADKQKAELDKQSKEHQMQLDQRKADQEFAHKERMAQLDFAIEQQKFGLEREKAQMSLEFDQQRGMMDMEHKSKSAEFELQNKKDMEGVKAEPRLEKVADTLTGVFDQLSKSQAAIAKSLETVAKVAAAPRKVVRDPKTGKVLRGEVDLGTMQ